MRTCKFYSPSKTVTDRYPSAEAAVGYEFNGPFHHAACACDKVKGTAPYAVCNYENEYGGCSFYEPEEFHVTKSVIVDRQDAKIDLLRSERLSMRSRRIGPGVPEYEIILEALINTETGEYGNAVTLHTIDPNVHGMSTKVIADTLWTKEIEEERSSYPYESFVHPVDKTPYVKTVVTV